MPIFLPGNRITLLKSGADQYFPALEAAIDGARRDVHIETYIFADDPTGRRIAEALVRAAQRGVAVKVVVDGFGTRAYSGSLLTELHGRGVELSRTIVVFHDVKVDALQVEHIEPVMQH